MLERRGRKQQWLAEPGKKQPAAIGRAVAAYLVQDVENLTIKIAAIRQQLE